MTRWGVVILKFRVSSRSRRIAAFAMRLRRVIQDREGSEDLVYHTTNTTPQLHANEVRSIYTRR